MATANTVITGSPATPKKERAAFAYRALFGLALCITAIFELRKALLLAVLEARIPRTTTAANVLLYHKLDSDLWYSSILVIAFLVLGLFQLLSAQAIFRRMAAPEETTP